MASDSEDFKFNLDTKDAVGQVMKLKDEIVSLGDSKNLSGLINGFVSMAGPVAAAGAMIFAIKASLDLAKEGEQIERINNNFDSLAKQSGIAASVLREGIEKATGGMTDMEDALQSANKAIAELGPNAEKIPQMFELARKVGKVYGGETTENFEKISSAIANGNTRMLKHIGLKVDAQKVEQQYALSIGKTVDTLTAAEKQQALLNAVLAKGEQSFKNIGSEGETVGGMLKQIGVQIGEFGDMIAVAFGKSAFIKDMVRGWRDGFGMLTDYMKSKFGTETEQSAAKVQDLSQKLNELKYKAYQIQEGEQGILSKWFGPSKEKVQKQIEETRRLLQEETEKQKELEAKDKADKEKEIAEAAKNKKSVHEASPEEMAKARAQRAAFEKDLLTIKQQRLASEMAIETDAGRYSDGLKQQQVFIEEQTATKIAEIRAKAAQGGQYTQAQAAELIVQLEADKVAKIKALQDDQDQNQLKVYENQVKQAKTASEGMVAAFAQGSAQARQEMKDYGKQGQQTFQSVKNNAVAAFKAMGDGSKSAGDAIKGFLLNSIADYVEMKGQAMLLEGLWPPNPVAIAAGGGLIALASAMRAAAGSTGGGGAAAGGGGGGAGGGVPSAQDVSANKPEPEMQKQKSVTIQVQGNYFETEAARQRMTEMIRENTDATDFKYQQIGVGA